MLQFKTYTTKNMSIVDQYAKRALPGQEKFANDIRNWWNCRLVVDVRVEDGIKREDEYQPLDYIILKKDSNKVVGYLELKNRGIESTKYDSLMLDHSKMMKIRITHWFTHLPVFVGVRYLDKDLYYEYDSFDEPNIFYGGRTTQTRNEYDIKQVEYISLDKFKEFNKK